MNQAAIRRLTVLCAELSAARHWLAAELDTPCVPDLPGCACRALRKVDQLSPLVRRIGGESVAIDALVLVARQLAVVLRRPDLGLDESRAGVNLAVETLSLAARLGLSLTRRSQTCRRVAAVLASCLWICPLK